MLDKAGVKPPTTWAEVKDVATKPTGNGVYGIAFSAPATEEGSWQFEPWFWGAGGDLKKLDSPEGVKALTFWADVVNSGYECKSVVTWNKGDVDDQFVAGKAAMMQNGVWNLGSLDKAGIKYSVVPSPKPDGGAAPGPMGGEVVTIPLSKNQDNMQADGKLVNYLLSDKSILSWRRQNLYFPALQALATQLATAQPAMD